MLPDEALLRLSLGDFKHDKKLEKDAFKRYNKFHLAFIKEKDINGGLNLLEILLDNVKRYVEKRCMMEKDLKNYERKYGKDRSYKDLEEELGKSRTLTHNALIDSILFIKRYIFNNSEKYSFLFSEYKGNITILQDSSISKSTGAREVVAQWAFILYSGLANNKIKNAA